MYEFEELANRFVQPAILTLLALNETFPFTEAETVINLAVLKTKSPGAKVIDAVV